MRRLGLAMLVSSCASIQSWTVPQPYFRTTQPDAAWARALKATAEHCGGIRNSDEASAVIVGNWIAWNTPDGLVLTQCLVSLLRGDEYVRDVRVSFAARRCPLSSMDDLEALVPTCEIAETVPEQVKNGLVDTGQKLEADINKVDAPH